MVVFYSIFELNFSSGILNLAAWASAARGFGYNNEVPGVS
jgi:hypothetical protein